MALRAATAAGFSVGIARLCGLAYPIYALLAAVIVTDFSPSRTREFGLQRLVATAVGAGSGAGLRQILTSDGWAVGLGILVAKLIYHVLRVHDGAKVAGYVCGIVMVAHGTNSWSYAFLRLGNRAWNPGGLANKFRSGFGSDRGGRPRWIDLMPWLQRREDRSSARC